MNSESRIVIVGSGGQLGRELVSRWADQAVALTRKEADLTNAEQLRESIEPLRPHVVVNCAAYNFVDQAEDDSAAAFAVNTFAVRTLAEICRDLDARLVHLSTDYVFGRQESRRFPYQESDPPAPIGVYGISKLAGEYFARAYCPRHLVIRTSGLYGDLPRDRPAGGKGTNFVETMLRLARQGKPIRVVADQTLTPSYVPDVAAAVVRMVEREAGGLAHVVNGGHCTWFEFARTIFELAEVHADLSATTTQEFASRARRPAYSVLATERIDTPPLRDWRLALASYLGNRS